MHASWYAHSPIINDHSWFILLNRYSPSSLVYNWSLQVELQGNQVSWLSAGSLQNVAGNVDLPINGGPGTLTITPGKWIDIVCMIDLDNNDVETYIDGKLLAKHPWKSASTSALAIAAVDLFANPQSGPTGYGSLFDDICLMPDKPSVFRRGLKDGLSSVTPVGGGFEPSYRGSDLSTLYPAASWKNYDDPTGNRFFGTTWVELPNCHAFKGEFVTRIQPSFSGSGNDVLYLGLNPQSMWPSSLVWGSAIASIPGTGGTWNFGDSPKTITMDLGNMPAGSSLPAGYSFLPFLNDHPTNIRKFDMMFQDDTAVDYAELKLWTCCPPFSGIPAFAMGRAQIELTPSNALHVTTASAESGVGLQLGDATSARMIVRGSPAFRAINSVTRLIGKCKSDCCGFVDMIGVGTGVRYDYDLRELGLTSVTIREMNASGEVVATSNGGAHGSYIPIQPGCDGDWHVFYTYNPITRRWRFYQTCANFHHQLMISGSTGTLSPNQLTEMAIETTNIPTFELLSAAVGAQGTSGTRSGDPILSGIGEATLHSYSGAILARDIGATGNDGVLMETGTASEISHTTTSIGGDLATLPAGARLTRRVIGIRNGVPGQTLNVVRETHFGDGTYEIVPNFDAIGAPTYVARFYRDGVLLATETHDSNARAAICVGKGENRDEKDKGGRPTTSSPPRRGSSKRIAFPADTSVIADSGPLLVDLIEIEATAASGVTIDGLQAIEITALGIPEFTITDTQAKHPVSGQVTLGDYGPPTDHPVAVEVRAPGSSTVLESHSVLLGEAGECEFDTALTGEVDISIKASHWLRKTFSSHVSEIGLSGWSIELVNGDSDGDNEVGISDYAILSSGYNSSEGDPHWDPRADLNGDQSVDIADYAILSSNYGLTGDE
ncbi:MAG: hypothetical protein K1X67_14620 [Fimbriimonadaceae bacterium]|nr:hypothetical protein [Fimbriimonadaceae bacterium]